MKLRDKDILGSTTSVLTNLRGIISVLNEESSKLQDLKVENDYVLVAFKAIANYSDVNFERLLQQQSVPIEYTAISARNLFECYLLIA